MQDNNKKNELEIFRENISENKIEYYGDGDEVIKKIIYNRDTIIYSSERPDIVIEFNDYILYLEHFEFDSSYNKSSKGSTERVKESERTRKFNKEVLNSSVKDIMQTKLEHRHCKEYYIANLLRIFKIHYEKFDKYQENIRKNLNTTKKIKSGFFIEDITEFGNFILEDGSLRIASPIEFKEFIDLLEDSEKLDYVFISYPSLNTKCNNIFFNNKIEILDSFRDKIKLTKNSDFIRTEPVEIRGKVVLPQDNINLMINKSGDREIK